MNGEEMTRRGFLAAGGASLAAIAAHGEDKAPAPAAGAGSAPAAAAKPPANTDPFLGTQGAPLVVGAPCLQAPGETTMGVSWAVSGLSKGVVEYADNPEMRDAKTTKSGGYGLVPIDVSALQARLNAVRQTTITNEITEIAAASTLRKKGI